MRQVHAVSKAERVIAQESMILKKTDFIKQFMVDGKDLDISKIKPTLKEVTPGSKWETIFKWWNLVWWSLPYERAYGRQIRLVVWDEYHKAPIGLIGLQSPILSWAPRDTYLGIGYEKRDYWVNQSLNAQRLGALPPYNNILGGKLVASMMTAPKVRNIFERKYKGLRTLISERVLPSNLLFLTTTGAFGKSSVYSKLKIKDDEVATFIGYTKGTGTFHIPNQIYEKIVSLLESKKIDVRRGYGAGPSKKVRLIQEGLQLLGFEDGINHNVKRSIYLFPLVKNLKEVIKSGCRPKWINRSTPNITSYWKEKWAIPRAAKEPKYLEFDKEKFILNTFAEVEELKRLYKELK